ncbi:MAG: hypothetical protein AW10_03972 [Candidatus Accumulibacter appositus]|uniref:NAD-specific glutamate dehydrogenase n=1 Tax=Candidatus Accumulibacter appositus TaxID=1454003 RepID=A0A011NPB9_9PROT|nr:MAG: hypothetical protein AW10_03972 [Candidatus Accumulibacter appositus]
MVMGQHDFRQINAFPLTAKLQQRQEALVEDRAFLDGRVAVIEYLRQEGVEADEGTEITLEQDQGVHFVLGVLGSLVVLLSLRSLQGCLRGLVAFHQAVTDRFEGGDQVALLGVWLQLHGDDAIDLEVVVVTGGIQLGTQVEDEVRIGGRREFGRRVVGPERGEDFLGVIHEIQDVGRVLAGVGAVETGEGLHGLDAGQSLIHVHAAEQRLVEAGLKFVGDEEDLVLVAFEGFADVATLQVRVQGLAMFREAVRAGGLVIHLAGERDQRADLVALALDVFVDSQLPAYCFDPTADDDHRLGLAAEQRNHKFAEVLDDDLDLLGNVVGVQAHPVHDALQRGASLDRLLVVVGSLVCQLEGQLVARVVLQYVEDEPLLDRLAHRIDMEGRWQIARASGLCRVRTGAEQFQRLVLRRRREGGVGDAGVAGAHCHLGRENVFGADLATVFQLRQFLLAQHGLELCRRLSGLRAMSFVGDHREALAFGGGQFAHGLDREGEGLDRADDNLLVAG